MTESNSIEMQPGRYDVIVVGAGFAGLYAVHKMREAGHSVRLLEAGSGIGGVWFWNRYPGARCDIESMQYSYSFSEEIQQEWNWSEVYASQPEILAYLNFVADRLDLHKDIQLDTRVKAARWSENDQSWTLLTEAGETFIAQFCIMATGVLSIPIEPQIEGLDAFEGELCRTSRWPHEGVDFKGKRVGLIGTGSSGIQVTPIAAEQAAHLTVFQRTANFSIPAQNRPMDEQYERSWKDNYPARRAEARTKRNNAIMFHGETAGDTASEEELFRVFEERWQMGGIYFLYGFTDLITSERTNEAAARFVRQKIAEKVEDPEVARKLMPMDHPLGTKRICADTNYYETFNRENVHLVDLREEPLVTITQHGLRTKTKEYELDMIVLATGFDALTGALKRIDIVGRGGAKLRDKWDDAPRTFLGLSIAGFPNMFVITGPGSPSVLSNMVTSIEQNVDWVADCIDYLQQRGLRSIEATEQAEIEWFDHVNEVANETLMVRANSWYVGGNVEGKPRVFLAYAGGVPRYLERCKTVAEKNYEGFLVA